LAVRELDVVRWAAELVCKAARARALRAESVRVAREVAAVEEEMAATLAQLALEYPEHVERLRPMSRAAVKEAVREREWHARHAGAPRAGDDSAV